MKFVRQNFWKISGKNARYVCISEEKRFKAFFFIYGLRTCIINNLSKNSNKITSALFTHTKKDLCGL